MIAIVDYDMGNLRSVEKAFLKLGLPAEVTRSPKNLLNASHIVLPGVGAFKDCMRNLDQYGLIDPILRSIEAGKPFLGICLGLQLLFEESTEFGVHKGLGLLKGRVVRFSSVGGVGLKVPHMGWNSVMFKKQSPLMKDIPEGEYFYFVHSYYAAPDDPDAALTTTDYGLEFVSSIAKDNITACQFHPEKSQKAGLKVLKNFGSL
ncbi:MAG: imidazole glycerol phosphate synthase subunit HisH [Deltaproteobacteria bacterium]|nr:imidazole glycerol phosphate synthase subunit HisH [Deltaproteobacteria bacterium]